MSAAREDQQQGSQPGQGASAWEHLATPACRLAEAGVVLRVGRDGFHVLSSSAQYFGLG
ncbi:MAG: hypothetical protein RLW61_16350 [Gammaproteobacteria bacterium]